MGNNYLTDSEKMPKGRRACAIPTKCHTPERRSFEELMSSNWEEFVIRYDARAGRYVTRTACCPGSPACC